MRKKYNDLLVRNRFKFLRFWNDRLLNQRKFFLELDGRYIATQFCSRR
jgi:hypothetical protein